MSEPIWVTNFVALYGISEADWPDKEAKLARWAVVHDATVEVARLNYSAEVFVKIMKARLSGAELETLKLVAKKHKDYPAERNLDLANICGALFYLGDTTLVGFYKGDETVPVPKCLKCGKLCPDLKGHIVIRSHQREWICQECWEAAFGKEEGEKDADSH